MRFLKNGTFSSQESMSDSFKILRGVFFKWHEKLSEYSSSFDPKKRYTKLQSTQESMSHDIKNLALIQFAFMLQK